MKTIEQLEADLAKANEEIGTLKAAVAKADKAKADAEAMAEEAVEAEKAAQKALADATDEVIKVGDEDVRKSEVGAATFKSLKLMADDRDMARLEKRASDEFSHLPGTATEKALVLKGIEGMTDAAKAAATAMLTAAEKMAAAGFGRFGVNNSDVEPTRKAAEGTFMSKVAEIQKRDNCKQADAMRKARMEFPQEFAAYSGAAN